MVAGLGVLLSHGAHVIGDSTRGFGLGISQGLRAPNLSPQRGRSTFLNVKKLWWQWRSLCFLLNSLVEHNAYLFPVTSSRLQPFSNAVGWSSWVGSPFE